tara:strand:+ start:2266 stop:2787 length:522 start_codon:yes stop_codon:yes gene_type:complete
MDRIYHLLRKLELQKHKVSSFDFQLSEVTKAEHFGIIYSVDSGQNQIEKLVNMLKSEGKKVKCLGFVSSKITHRKLISNYLYTYISKKECNWWGRPIQKEIDPFVQTTFDVVYSLDSQFLFPLQYITNVISAKIKCGFRNEQFPHLVDIALVNKDIDFLHFHNFVKNISINAG